MTAFSQTRSRHRSWPRSRPAFSMSLDQIIQSQPGAAMNYAQGAPRPLPPASTHLDFDALFKSMSLDGIYARTGTYESVVSGLAAFISTFREADVEILRFPPVMSR